MTDDPFTTGEPEDAASRPDQPPADRSGHPLAPEQENPSLEQPRWRWSDRLGRLNRPSSAPPLRGPKRGHLAARFRRRLYRHLPPKVSPVTSLKANSRPSRQTRPGPTGM